MTSYIPYDVMYSTILVNAPIRVSFWRQKKDFILDLGA